MRIACFWGVDRSLDRVSFRHEHLVTGFAALGHDPFLLTARGLAGRYTGPIHEVDDLAALARPATWRASGAELAVGVTWLGMAPILEAAAAAGVPRVAVADSDGQLGYAAHPRAAWARIAPRAHGLRDRLRTTRYFLRRFRAGIRGDDAEELAALASLRASTRVAFGSDMAIAALRRFLARHGSEALADRAFVAPFPVPPELLAVRLGAREDRLVGIGRWSDPQKDAPLLAAALARFLAARPATVVELFGADAREAFGALAAREPRLVLRGIAEPHEIHRTLAASRSLVLASRWETGPHVAGEALALGATIVSVPLPNSVGMIEGHRYGALAARRTPAALADALLSESARWDRGERDARSIASIWRERLAPAAFARTLLAGLGSADSRPASPRPRGI